jgi:hypothetical protein
MFGNVKGDNVYTGTVKICINIKGYEEHGDSRFVPFVRINSMVEGDIINNTDIIEENAVLIRVNDNTFVNAREAEKKGIFKSKRLSTFPEKDGDLFVDKKTIVPYFSEINKENNHVNIKQLVKKNDNQ